METFSALLAICAGNSPVPGEFPTQRPVTRSFDVYFDLRPNKRLSKQSLGWWFETLSPPLWRHRNVKTKVSHLSIKREKSKIHLTLGNPTMPLYPYCRTIMSYTDPTIFGKRQVIEIFHAAIPSIYAIHINASHIFLHTARQYTMLSTNHCWFVAS